MVCKIMNSQVCWSKKIILNIIYSWGREIYNLSRGLPCYHNNEVSFSLKMCESREEDFESLYALTLYGHIAPLP